MCLNNLFAGILFKGQCGAVFQQGICVKTKNPARMQERESSWVSKTSKEKQRQVGRQRRREWLAEGNRRGVDGHESRNISEMQLQRTSQKKTRCSNLVRKGQKK